MTNTNFDDVLALSPVELRRQARRRGWALSALGSVVYAVLRILGQKPQSYEGICPFFTIGKSWGGLELGWFFICGRNDGHATRAHEVGHILQNAKIGGLKVLGLWIKSATRYWADRLGKLKTPYHSWWFEGQATTLGVQYVERWKDNDINQ